MNDTMDFSDPVTEAARELFGMAYLFPYQRLVVANILEAAEAAGIPLLWPGEDRAPEDAAFSGIQNTEEDDRAGRQIVILPTGAGKSLCFQLPAMILGGATLVLYPILSLMADQERRLRERGFSPALLRGGQSVEEREEIWRKIKSGESRFIISNPETLLTPGVREKLPELGIVHVVIDEAHCVSEWGESFRPSYLEIGKIIAAAKNPGGPEPLVTAFTATASAAVLEKIGRYIFGGPENARRITGNPGRINIKYSALGCLSKDSALRDCLASCERPAIVFCSSRHGTEKLARRLREALGEREIRFYHAGLSREEKKAVEDWFFASADGILVSTCAYGMGVDKPDIRTVIHRDLPPSIEAYLQESGRAGRDGAPSLALLLWGPEDAQALARAGTQAARKRIESLLAYARNTGNCRREGLLALLDWEGQSDSPPEGCCDVCGGTARDRPREEGPLLAFFRKNRRRYDLAEASALLSADGRWTAPECKSAIQALITEGKLREMKGIFWKKRIIPVRRGSGT